MGDRGRKARQKHQQQHEKVKNLEKKEQTDRQQPKGGPVTKVPADQHSG